MPPSSSRSTGRCWTCRSPRSRTRSTRGRRPPTLPAYVADRVLPRVVDASVDRTARPRWRRRRSTGGAGRAAAELVGAWLRERDAGPGATVPGPGRHGPGAGSAGAGPPASSRRTPPTGGAARAAAAGRRSAYFSDAGEALVTGPRASRVLPLRSTTGSIARMTCAGCGEQSGPKLPIFGETERFPHLRVDACETLPALPVHRRPPEGARRRSRSSTSWRRCRSTSTPRSRACEDRARTSWGS